MNTLGVATAIIGCLIMYYIIRKKLRKPKKNKIKSWVILEHEEGNNEKTMKCYRAEHKENERASPCFKQINDLNKWIQQNGTTKTA